MTLWLVLGFGVALLGGLVFFWVNGKRAGRDAHRADDAEQALDAINDAIESRDSSRLDADKRERLRDKYRGS
jgi:hypothetical protein